MNRTNHGKGEKRPPEPLSQDEVKLLLSACSKRAPTGIRDRALIVVLWRAQLRISEALALKVADFDPVAAQLRVLKGKGKKSRVVILDDQSAAELALWLKTRSELGFNGHRPIFCTLQGGPVNAAQIRAMLKRRAKKVGITKRVHAHGLRHTGASEMVAEGVPLLDIQEQLGHSSAATTNKYLHQLNPLGRASRLRSRTW